MRRRDFITLLGGAVAWPLAARAQQDKIARVGLLTLNAPAQMVGRLSAFRYGMRELGYREGENIVFLVRFAEGRVDRLAALTAELLQANVDVIVPAGYPSIRAAQQASSTIPIVVAIMSDPIGEGFAASYARPGGNITGLAFQDADLTTKRLEILREVVPSLLHVAVLWDEGMPAGLLKATESAAHALGLTLEVLPAGDSAEVGEAFDTALGRKAQALFQVASPRFSALRDEIAALAIEKGMPAACEQRDFAIAGCLVSYGPSFDAMFRRAAYYVDKILKGAKPADLPIEQPTKFELVVNLKTAQAIGLTIPPALLLRADEVIE
jgi:putative ABC transport system substrate-binding protein